MGLYTTNKLYSRYTKLYWECQPCAKKHGRAHTDNGSRKRQVNEETSGSFQGLRQIHEEERAKDERTVSAATSFPERGKLVTSYGGWDTATPNI